MKVTQPPPTGGGWDLTSQTPIVLSIVLLADGSLTSFQSLFPLFLLATFPAE